MLPFEHLDVAALVDCASQALDALDGRRGSAPVPLVALNVNKAEAMCASLLVCLSVLYPDDVPMEVGAMAEGMLSSEN